MYFITRKHSKNKSHYLLNVFPKSSQIKKNDIFEPKIIFS